MTKAKELTSCFSSELPYPTQPTNSDRFRTFESVVTHAEASLKGANPELVKPLQDDRDAAQPRYVELYEYFCKENAAKVARLLVSRGHKELIIAFDECGALNVSPNVANSMSIMAVWRIVKAADQFSTQLWDGFAFWHTYLDTSSSVFALVPPKGKLAPSERLVASLEPLPPFVYLGFNQMWESGTKSPQEALKIAYIKRMGRPVSCYALAIDIYPQLSTSYGVRLVSTLR